MHIFELTTLEDFKLYISGLFILLLPIIFILLIPYFLYTSFFIDVISNTFEILNDFPFILQWLLFTVVPFITVGLFFTSKARTIFIDKDSIQIDYKSNIKEKINISDINKFIVYKTASPLTWNDSSKNVNHSTLFPIAIQKENNSKINILVNGEILNCLKSKYPELSFVWISPLNRYSIVMTFLAIINLINGIAYLFTAIGYGYQFPYL